MDMPLPKTPVSVHYLDKNSQVQETVIERRETGYQPDEQYYPTMRLVKCGSCNEVGVVEFKGGLNLKEGDRLMDGKSIYGTCMKCGKRAEFVPLPVNDQNEQKVRLYYQIQEALTEAVRRGERLGPTGMVWPLARVLEWEKWKERQDGSKR